MLNWLRQFGKSTPAFAVGDSVRVAAGPFTAFNGKVEAVEGSRIHVAVSIQGRVVMAEIPASDLEKTRSNEDA